jgi:hypothetical protein
VWGLLLGCYLARHPGGGVSFRLRHRNMSNCATILRLYSDSCRDWANKTSKEARAANQERFVSCLLLTDNCTIGPTVRVSGGSSSKRRIPAHESVASPTYIGGGLRLPCDTMPKGFLRTSLRHTSLIGCERGSQSPNHGAAQTIGCLRSRAEPQHSPVDNQARTS